jgi:hypothetical protein
MWGCVEVDTYGEQPGAFQAVQFADAEEGDAYVEGQGDADEGVRHPDRAEGTLMADSKSSSATASATIFPWFALFVVEKVWGTGLATWSWWWVLLSPFPGVWFILTKLGWL